MAVNHEIVPSTLSRADGTTFENFANAFFSALLGADFVPLGGMHDGGADAYLVGVTEDERGRFLQSSIRADHRPKISETLKALKKGGREVKQLIYATSKLIPYSDQEEDALTELHGLTIKIRDRNFFRFHINDTTGTEAAFDTYLKPLMAAFLNELGGADLISVADNSLPARSLCVFLGQELERRRGNTDLLEAVTDTLILWALRETDPDGAIFLTRHEILDRITTALPSAKQFIVGTIDTRLSALASKAHTSGREVRHHTKQDNYCLPYDTRKIVAAENAEDEELKTKVTDVFVRKLKEHVGEVKGEPPFSYDDAIAVCFRTIELTFEEQGIETAHFLGEDVPNESIQRTIIEQIDEAIDQLEITGPQREPLRSAVYYVMRKAYYESEDVERQFLNKLCRTFCLLFTLRNHPHIVEYFRGMSSKLVLYVGSDMIVRALSEQFLRPQDQMTRNMFAILKKASGTLILTERNLEEVYTHLIANDQEYRNHYQRVSTLMTPIVARQIHEILIRTYFYAAIEARQAGKDLFWSKFLGQFLTYSNLYNANGRESLKRYLSEAFGFEYEEETVSRNTMDLVELDELRAEVKRVRPWKTEQADVLAENDAFQVLRVYAKRSELKEGVKPNRYGYRTWWLTQENAVRKATGKLVMKKGAPYIMRPEFLLNYISLSPKMEEVRASYEAVFPTLLGVQLSNRLKPETFNTFMNQVSEAHEVDEPRARSLMSEMSDRLISDQFKQYPIHFPELGSHRT